ncbi:MAG: ATP-binding protein [Calditrichaeota bacterium]|nr:ATP-binding protein [Calditrichota bacterium]
MKRQTERYKITTPSESINLELIRDFVGKLARRAGFAEDNVNKIQLATDEACTNVVKHAYKNLPVGPIQVEITLNNEKFVVTVSDKGVGFDIANLTRPDMVEYLNQFKKGGLGIHLIQTLMDQVTFRVNPFHKNSVKMIKYIHRTESADKLRQQEIIMKRSRNRR